MTEYGLVLVSGPSDEPVSLVEAKRHCRIDHDDEDSDVLALVTAAREHCEALCQRAFVTQTWRLELDRFPEQCQPWSDVIRLPRPRLQSVTSVQYVDVSGVLRTLSAGLYQVDVGREPARLAPAYGQVWPATRDQMAAVKVTYDAGFGGTDVTPKTIRQAILLLAGHWYEHREAVAQGGWEELPVGVAALLGQHRVDRYA